MHLNGINLFNICREKPKVTLSNASWVSALYLCSSGTTLTLGLSTKTLPVNALLHSQAEPYMGWGGVKKPFSIPVFQSRISTSSTSQEWQYLCHKLLALQKYRYPRSWVTPAILFTLLRRNAVNYPGSPESRETAGKPLDGPLFTRLENRGEAALSNLWLLFPARKNQNSWCGGNGESQDGFSVSFKGRTLSCSPGVRGEVVSEWGMQPQMSSLLQDVNCCWEYLRTVLFNEVICWS